LPGALFAAAGLIANYNSTFTVTHGPIFWRSWTEVLGTELGDLRRVIPNVDFVEVACTSVAKVFDQSSEAWTRAWSDAFQRALKGAS
jgi:hypothetical protein